MFEKEAKKWADKKYPCDGQAQRYLLMGANFGYNKAKEEMQVQIEKMSESLQKNAEKLVDNFMEENYLTFGFGERFSYDEVVRLMCKFAESITDKNKEETND